MNFPTECPECGSRHLACEAMTWVNIDYGHLSFDAEDANYAEPKPGGRCICRDCQHEVTMP